MQNFLTAAPAGGMASPLIMMVLMFAIFYFMLIRPENKRKKEAEQMRSSVRTGDKIVTIGGIVGTVVNVKESRIVIETGADQVRIELEKWAISSNETAEEAAKTEAKKAQEAARALFAKGGNNMENVPTVQIEKAKFEGEGMNVVTMLVEAGLVPSRSEGMRTVQQGGLTIEDEKIGDPKLNVTVEMFKDGKLLVRKGKKTYKMIELN